MGLLLNAAAWIGFEVIWLASTPCRFFPCRTWPATMGDAGVCHKALKARERRAVTRHLGNVSTKIWHADDLGGAELLRGRFSDFSYDVHTHDKACLALITRGAIRIKTLGMEFRALAGDLFAIDADKPHAGWPIDDNGWSLRTIYVDVARLQELVGVRHGRVPPALAGPIIRDSRLTSLFRGVHSCSEVAGPALKREEGYLEFIGRLFERHTRGASPLTPPSREERPIRLARDFLDHHLDQQVRLADVAQAAGLPAFRLFRAFERATGMSPHRYQRQARVRFAAGLIRLGHALSDAALAAGFADQAHMTRSFRSTMGVTPGAYRGAFVRVGRTSCSAARQGFAKRPPP